MKRRILLLLSEKSTYAGLIAFLSGTAAFGLNEAVLQQAASAIAAIAGLIMALTLEKGNAEQLKQENGK